MHNVHFSFNSEFSFLSLALLVRPLNIVCMTILRVFMKLAAIYVCIVVLYKRKTAFLERLICSVANYTYKHTCVTFCTKTLYSIVQTAGQNIITSNLTAKTKIFWVYLHCGRTG